MPPKKAKRPKKKPVKKKAKSKPTNVQQQQQTVNVFLAGKSKSKAKKRGAPKQRGVSATQAMFGGLIGQQNALLNNLDARNDARLNTLEQLMLQKKVEDNSIGTEPAGRVGAGSNFSDLRMLPRREAYSEEFPAPQEKPTGPMTPLNTTSTRRPSTNGPKKGSLFSFGVKKKE